jgi:outer membrane protein
MKIILKFSFSFLALICIAAPLCPQTAAGESAAPPSENSVDSHTSTFTLREAVDYALAHYPAVQAALERMNAARGGVGLAADSYLPRADFMWQADRATRNNILGTMLPQSSVIINPSGSVSADSGRTFWGSAGGVMLSWEPFDFGYRSATVQSARSTERRTEEQVRLTRLEVEGAVSEAAFGVLAAKQRVLATRADVDRRQVFAKSVHALVDAHLRPGADSSRADAELAAARTQLILAEQSEAVARATLAEMLGLAGKSVDIAPGPMLDFPPDLSWTALPVADNPLATVEQARVQEIQARLKVLDRTYYPKFNLMAAESGRGSGVNPDGTFGAGLQGLALQRANWAAGLVVTFPILDFATIRSRRKIELANHRREEALYQQTLQSISGQTARAQAVLEGARRVALNTPIQLKASVDAERQARARFEAGVARLVDVAETQRLLVQAEIDDSLARLGIWHALEQLAASQGDITPFLNITSEPGRKP